MSQHDYVIDNNTGRNVRLDINDALAAIVSLNAGTAAPTTTFPYMFWYDTTNNILKQRNSADSAWIPFILIDGSGFVNLGGTTALLQVDVTDGVIKLLGTNGTFIPQGTTLQRPTGTPTALIRYNTDTGTFEGFSNGAWNSLGGFTGYSAIVGSASFCTHATLAAALADTAVLAGSKILVTASQTINTTISITKANLAIDFLPGIAFTNGTAGTGITVGAGGTRIKGGRFVGFTTAISISSTFQYNFVTECRFNTCTAEVAEADSAPINVILANISE